MTATFRRGGSFAAFTWTFDILQPGDQAFRDLLAAHRFRSIERAASEETSVGWVTPGDPTGDTFDADDLDAGGASWLRFRMDAKKLPAAKLAMEVANAERARGRALSKRERRELRDHLHETLLPGILPRTQFVDVLLSADQKRAMLFASSKGAREAFGKLCRDTFGTPVDAMAPRVLASTGQPGDVADAVERLEPTRWPGGASAASGDDPHAFLGEEFLTWLWWKWETDGGEFTLPGGRLVGLSLDDLVVFTAASDDETQHTLRRGLPTRTAEARTALRQGHRVAKARLLIAEGSRQWSLVLDGSTMRFGSVKLPEDSEECESAIDRTADRAANWLALHEIVAALFGQFVRVRVGAEWRDVVAAAMAAWMQGGGS